MTFLARGDRTHLPGSSVKSERLVARMWREENNNVETRRNNFSQMHGTGFQIFQLPQYASVFRGIAKARSRVDH